MTRPRQVPIATAFNFQLLVQTFDYSTSSWGPRNISSISALQIAFRPPGGAADGTDDVTVTGGIFVSDGTDGLMQVSILTTHLTTEGWWTARASGDIGRLGLPVSFEAVA